VCSRCECKEPHIVYPKTTLRYQKNHKFYQKSPIFLMLRRCECKEPHIVYPKTTLRYQKNHKFYQKKPYILNAPLIWMERAPYSTQQPVFYRKKDLLHYKHKALLQKSFQKIALLRHILHKSLYCTARKACCRVFVAVECSVFLVVWGGYS